MSSQIAHDRRSAAVRAAVHTALVAMLVLTSGGCARDVEWSSWVLLTPGSADLTARVEAADARWEAAGVDPAAIRVVPFDGIRVEWLPPGDSMAKVCDMRDAHGVCGCLALNESSGPTHIWLDPRCGHKNVLAHELGHLLAGRPEHLGAAHGCSGLRDPNIRAPHLMCQRVGKWITEMDLALICDAAACVSFDPETESE